MKDSKRPTNSTPSNPSSKPQSLFFSVEPPKIASMPFLQIRRISLRLRAKCDAARRYSFETGLQKKPTSSVWMGISMWTWMGYGWVCRIRSPSVFPQCQRKNRKRKEISHSEQPDTPHTSSVQNDDRESHHQSSSHVHYTTCTTPALTSSARSPLSLHPERGLHVLVCQGDTIAESRALPSSQTTPSPRNEP